MISLSVDSITNEDIESLTRWLGTNPKLSKGPLTIEFEEAFSRYIGCRYSVFCNSGSSANLLMLYALKELQLLENKKIVVPGLSWATDYAPVVQLGLTPLLCDVNLQDLSVDIESLEEIFKRESPGAFLLVSILGFSPNMDEIVTLCYKYNVALIEDNCESLGTTFKGRKLGTFGLMSSFSSYFSHHICTIEGGIITTNDIRIYEFLIMARSHGWSRDLSRDRQYQLKQQFNINEFNNLYTFYIPGFNLRSTDLQAFLGLKQLERVEEICRAREANFAFLQRNIENTFWKVFPNPDSWTSNFAYPLIVSDRSVLVQTLIDAQIECRPLVCGSMATQPMHLNRFGKSNTLPNCKLIDDHGLYIPNNHNLKREQLEYMVSAVNSCTKLTGNP